MWSVPWTLAHWDFGDGAGIDLENPTHTYANPGLYRVAAISRDALGNTSAVIGDIVVTAPGGGGGGGGGGTGDGGGAGDGQAAPTPTPTPAGSVIVAPPATPPAVAAPVGTTRTDPPRVAIDAPACPRKLSAAACSRQRHEAAAWRTLRGSATGAGRVTVRATHGHRAISVNARISGSHWTARLPRLSRGRWTITVRAGSATARRSVTIR